MKKVIFASLGAVFIFFSLGAGTAWILVDRTTGRLARIVELHRVENLRQNLIIQIHTVQTDICSVGTPMASELTDITNHVDELDSSIAGCLKCHHDASLSRRLLRLQVLIDSYKTALSYYITTRANSGIMEAYKQDAVIAGNRALGSAQQMVFEAGQKMEEQTKNTLQRIKVAKFILFATMVASFFLALATAVYLFKRISNPLSEILKATKMLASDNLGMTIVFDDKTEFGEVARNFNIMSQALQEGYKRLADSENKFRRLCEFAADWEYWIDENRERLIFNSPSCEQLTGYTQEELERAPGLIREIVHPDDRDVYDRHMADFPANMPEEIGFRIVTKNGEEKWLSHRCRPIFVNGRFAGRRVSNRDVTDNKKLEGELRQAQKMESLGLLAGGIAHDFNNILTVISGYLSLLQLEMPAASEKSNRYITQVLGAAERARNLTSNLLVFSRKQIINRQPCSLNKQLSQLYNLLKRIVREDIEFTLECCRNEAPVFADPNQIDQVVMNLVTNAKDAMPQGGKLTIATSLTFFDEASAQRYKIGPGPYMSLSVSDTGEGIAEEHLAHIFEPFFTTKERYHGTGLGLSMVYGIVKQHGGFIKVYTKEGGWGTTFRLYFPVHAGKIEAEQGLFLSGENEKSLRGRETVLIIEDDENIREMLQEVLEQYGYRAISAENGYDGLEKYAIHKDEVKLIIMDVIMPKMNGFETYKRIKALSPEMKIMFMSGYAQDILTSKGIAETGLEFIAKPVPLQELLLRMRKILDKNMEMESNK